MTYPDLKNLPRNERRKIIQNLERDFDGGTLNSQCFCGSEKPFKICCYQYNQGNDPILDESSENFYRTFSEVEKEFLSMVDSKVGIGHFEQMAPFMVDSLGYQFFNFCYLSDKYAVNNDDIKLVITSGPTKKSIEIFKLEVFNSGNGMGTEILNTLIDIADILGIMIFLIPLGYKDTPNEVLFKWYSKNGFQLVEGSCYWNYEPKSEESYRMAS